MKRKLTSLNDIAGYDKVKKEAAKLIDLLKNYSKYQAEGAFIPSGLLISGECGIGKTLLARAIIDQSELPSYIFDGTKSYDSSKTTKYMKETFEAAKKNTPCILFIDELDQLVSKTGFGEFKSDATEAFTKLMMSEIDGLNNTEGVFIICTTNDIERLPEAVLRSGRMDKKIALKTPTSSERKLIIQHYTSKNKRFKDINIDDLIKITNGFTGADLKTAINEALIEAIHTNVNVSDTLLSRKFDEIRFSSIEQTTDEIDDRVIYHELGHAIVHHDLLNEFTQISVESMGNAEGAVIPVMPNESKAKTFDEIKKNFSVAIAGLTAEEAFFECGSLGCLQDIGNMKNMFFQLSKTGYYGFDVLTPVQSPFGVNEAPNDKFLSIQNEVFAKAKEVAKNIIEDRRDFIEYLKPILKKQLRISPREFENYMKEYEDLRCSCPQKAENGQISLKADHELYELIKNDVSSKDYCSISYIQRTYSIGFPKAGRIFAQLQEDGIIDRVPDNTSKGCKVLAYTSK